MKISFGMYWQQYGRQEAEIPDMQPEDIASYLEDHWSEIPLPEGDYVMGSDELDVESIEIEELQKDGIK